MRAPRAGRPPLPKEMSGSEGENAGEMGAVTEGWSESYRQVLLALGIDSDVVSFVVTVRHGTGRNR